MHPTVPTSASVVPAPPGRMQLSPRWLAFAALALAIPVGALMANRDGASPDLPNLGELPAFALTDQTGRAFQRSDLAGRVWIVDFIFTSCAEACPRLTQKMRHLQDRLTPPKEGGRIGLLSLSVDPERDTPARLGQYAATFGARPETWHFLTGSQLELERTVVQGFHMVMAKAPRVAAASPIAAPPAQGVEDLQAEAFDIMHGERLVLVDARGAIRGYYDADDAEHLLRDARKLERMRSSR